MRLWCWEMRMPVLTRDVYKRQLYRSIPKDVVRIEERNPEILFKAVKNPVEIENIRHAQIKDRCV